MRIFHLSDLHIGLKLKEHDLRKDQEYIFERIAGYAGEHQPDVIVIAGDIYDKAVPSAEAVDMFDSFVSRLGEVCPKAYIMMISGNHDSASRVNVFRGLLAKQKVYMIGMPPKMPDEHIEKVTVSEECGEVDFWLLPFVKPTTVRHIVAGEGETLSYEESLRRLLAREDIDTSRRNVLVSHQFYLPRGRNASDVERMSSEIVTVGDIDSVSAELLEPFDYAALGHIHKPMTVGSRIYRYCGTPMPYSVDEAGQDKGVIMADMGEKGSVETTVLPLEPLHKVRTEEGTLEEVLSRPSEDYVTVILTDTAEHDIYDMHDRLYDAFPNLLEIRRPELEKKARTVRTEEFRDMSEYELCCEFMGEASDDEKQLLTELINEVKGMGGES